MLKKNITISLDFMPKRVFDFWHFNMEKESRLLNHVLNSFLFKWDPIRKRKLYLLKEPPYTIRASNGDYVVYNLRDDIKWQDGHPITASDFKFWFEVYKSDLNTNKYDAWANTELEIENAKCFKVLFKEPYVFRTLSNLLQPAPEHLLRKIWDDFNNDTKRLSKSERLNKWDNLLDQIFGLDTQLPLSSGPFIVSKIEKNKIQLKRNKYYWYNASNIETLEFIVQSEMEKRRSIENQDIDICSLTFPDVHFFKEKYNQIKVNTNTWITLLINHFWLQKLFCNENDQVELKRALNSIINDSNLLELMQDSTLSIEPSFIHGFKSKKTCIKTNIKEILKRYGYVLNKEGIFQDFKLSIAIPRSSLFYQKLAYNLKKILLNSGIKLKVTKIDDDTFYSSHFLNHASDLKFNIIPMAYQGDPAFEKGEIFSSLKSGSLVSNIPTKDNNFVGENISGFRNREYDLYFLKLSTEQNMDKREIYLFKLAELALEYVSSISLFTKDEYWLISSKIKKINFNALTGTISWNIDEWRIIDDN